jgi:hypothetical protein
VEDVAVLFAATILAAVSWPRLGCPVRDAASFDAIERAEQIPRKIDSLFSQLDNRAAL